MATLYLLAAPLAIFFLACLKRIASYQRNPLRRVPGPFWGRYTRLWLLKEGLRRRLHESMVELHSIYGPVVRLSPDTYSIADLDVAKEVYGIRTPYEKSEWYSTFTSPGSTTISTDRNNKHFAGVKRKFAASYSMSHLVHYEEHFDRSLKQLCLKLEEFASTNTACDLTKWLRLFAFDAIAEITFGKGFGGIQAGGDRHSILQITRASTCYAISVGIYPELHPWIWKMIPEGKGEKAAEDFTWKQVKERENLFHSRQGLSSLVDVWLGQNEKSQEKMSLGDIRMGIAANIGAGSDTTSQAMSSIIYLVHKHPNVLRRLQEEIDMVMAQDGASKDGMLRYHVTSQMPYLQAVIKESLRYYPVVGTILPRRVPKGGVDLAGYHFHEGLTIGVNLWTTRHNPKYFGEDAAEFRPERWLGTGDEVKRNEFYHMPFSIGPRSCIGKNIAMLEIAKTIPTLLHTFSFSLKSPVDGTFRFRNYIALEPEQLECSVKLRKLDNMKP